MLLLIIIEFLVRNCSLYRIQISLLGYLSFVSYALDLSKNFLIKPKSKQTNDYTEEFILGYFLN